MPLFNLIEPIACKLVIGSILQHKCADLSLHNNAWSMTDLQSYKKTCVMGCVTKPFMHKTISQNLFIGSAYSVQ